MELHTIQQIREWVEKSNRRKKKFQSEINSMLKERDVLIKLTRDVKVENITLKIQVQILREQMAKKEKLNKLLKTLILEFREKTLKINDILKRSVVKMDEETEYCQKTIESAKELNKRIKAAGLCSKAVYKEQNAKLERIQLQFAHLISNKAASTTAMDCFIRKNNLKQLKASSTETITETEDIDSQLEAIFKEFTEV